MESSRRNRYTGTAITVASLVATVTETAHGLLINDPITVSGATPTELNGNFIVATVPDANSFTYATTAVDGAAIGTIDIFAKYVFADGAWYGSTLPDDPGSITWKFQTLTGIIATPTTLMNSSQRGFAEGKNSNVYIENAGVSHTREGIMAGGRFIDVTRSVDWLDATMEEAVFAQLVNLAKVPYTNAGLSIIESEMTTVLNLALQQGVINPISDETPFTITLPKLSDIPTADRQNRLFPDIQFTALVGNAVHGVQIVGSLQV